MDRPIQFEGNKGFKVSGLRDSGIKLRWQGNPSIKDLMAETGIKTPKTIREKIGASEGELKNVMNKTFRSC